MALLFMESFDGYGGTASQATLWSTQGTLGTSSPVPRTGTYCARSTGFWQRVIAPGSQTIIAGYAFYWGGSQQGYAILYETAAFNLAQCSVTADTDGKVRVRAGDNSAAALGISASAVLVASSWNYIEWKITVGNSGTYEVKVNGVSVLSGSGDTQARSTSAIVGFSVSPGGSLNGVDDFFLLDSTGSTLNDYLGDCKVECLSPQAGNGSNTGLTCSTGTDHGALVDELPANDDTDYNYSATASVKDTYNFTNLASTGVVKAVQAVARARKTDSATKELALVARLGSTDYDGATKAVAATTYGQYLQIWETRPSDSLAWTVSDVNAAEFGLKVVS